MRGYGYTWWRHLNAIQPAKFERGNEYKQEVQNSPFGNLLRQGQTSAGNGDPWLYCVGNSSDPTQSSIFPI